MTEESIQNIEEAIEEIRKWERIQGLEPLSNILEDFDDRYLVIYHNADGDTTTSEIGDMVGVSRNRVSQIMAEWKDLGLVGKDGRQWEHLAPLSAMGIEEPEYHPSE